MPVPLFVVDAFTDTAFAGNPAAVCILDGPADAEWMQRVAAEMKHSETAFLDPGPDGWHLRWFTPAREVDLCGHATLASAHVLWTEGHLAVDAPVRFDTRSGILTCTRHADGRIAMDFPAAPTTPGDAPDGLFDALGIAPTTVHHATNENLLVELPDAAAVRALTPDFAKLLRVSGRHGYIVTATADDGDDADVVCRYFVPAWGIDEDPATGSVQCTMAPYWSDRFGPKTRTAQVSERGAVLEAELKGDRVVVSGQAVTVVRGTLDA